MAKRESDKKVTRFAGVDNKTEPHDIPEGYVQAADNLDIDDQMRVGKRDGRTQLVASTTHHSLFSHPEMGYGLMCNGANLERVDVASDGTVSQSVIRSDLMPQALMDYAYVNGSVYYTNGAQNGRYDGTQDKPWGVPVPPSQPALSATSGGLNPGRYQVVLVYVDTDGRESGAGLASSITLASTGGINLSGIPASGSSDIDRVRIYVTQPNGAAFFLHSTVSDGTTTAFIGTLSHGTIPLRTHFLDVPPSGSRVAYNHGRLFVAFDKYIAFSEPLAYHLFNRENYLAFPAIVDDIFAVPDGGLIVSADRLYFIPTNFNDTQEVPRKILAQYKAVPRSGEVVDGSDLGSTEGDGIYGVLATYQGIVAVSQSGSLRNLTDEHHAFDAGATGTTVVREVNGFRQLLSMVQDASSGANKYTSPENPPTVNQNGIT